MNEKEDYVEMIMNYRNRSKPSVSKKEASDHLTIPIEIDEEMMKTIGDIANSLNTYMIDERDTLSQIEMRVVNRIDHIISIKKPHGLERKVKARRVRPVYDTDSSTIVGHVIELDYVYNGAGRTEYIINHAEDIVVDDAYNRYILSTVAYRGACDHQPPEYKISISRVSLQLSHSPHRLRVGIVEGDKSHQSDSEGYEDLDTNLQSSLQYKVIPSYLNDVLIDGVEETSDINDGIKKRKRDDGYVYKGYTVDDGRREKVSYRRALDFIMDTAARRIQLYYRYKKSTLGRNTYDGLRDVKSQLADPKDFKRFLEYFVHHRSSDVHEVYSTFI